MTTFFDDFERANGSLGGNWVALLSSATINNGTVQGTSHWGAYNTTTQTSGRQEASVHYLWGTVNTRYGGCLVKCTGVSGEGFRLDFTGDTNYATVAIRGGTLSNSTVLASYTFGVNIGPLVHLRLVWDSGHLSGYVDGTLRVQVDSALWGAGVYQGMCGYGTAVSILDYQSVGGAEISFSIDPAAIGNYGACTELTLTGVGTSWTPGTPGSPTFTVDHGTISAQEVTSATSATITYCPGDFLGTAVFTDPSTGQTANVLVTSDPDIVPPGPQCPFNDDFIDLANNTPDGTLPSLWATNTYIGVAPIDATVGELYQYIYQYITDMYGGVVPGPGITTLLDKLWKITNNRNEQTDYAWSPSYDTSLKEDTEALRIWLESPPNDFSNMAAIVALLGGSPTVLSHVDLKTAIDLAATSGQAQDILDRLDELQGLSETNLTDLAGRLSSLTSNGSQSLQTILDAIAAIPGGGGGIDPGDIAAILAAIAAVALAVGVVGTGVTAVEATEVGQTVAIGAIAAELTAGIASILELLNAIQAALSAAAPPLYMPPVWPGLAHVTFGAVSDLATTVQVDGPMHGIEVEITATEPGTSFMQYDTVKSWRHIGGITFYNDRGMHETYQALNFGRALYVPKTMAVAQGVRLFKSHQPKGTVTPWTITG